jgi:chemosensory pili system protein ChpC
MAEQDSIRCIQLPLLNIQLLLPNAVVAEIISYVRPEQSGDDWLDGVMIWRGVSVPVVSVEKMCQQDYNEPGVRSRIAVIYNLFNDDEMPYLGIIMQDIPRAYLAEEDRMPAQTNEAGCEFLHGQADVMNSEMMIPNLDAIMRAAKQKLQSLG